jgi:hypothetical protein
MTYSDQVPHAFQELLSYEKTPTLCHAIPAFEAMISAWTTHAQKHPETKSIIQEGLDKLGGYSERTDLALAYVLAMGVYSSCICVLSDLFCCTAVDPTIKLKWIEKHRPDQLNWAKQIFFDAVSNYTL